jgi:predicted CoA-binding protein
VDSILTFHRKADEAQQVVAEIEHTGRKAVALQLDTDETKNFAPFTEQVKTALSFDSRCRYYL